MLYGSKCWAVDKKIEQRTSVAELRILRWMSGVTIEDEKMRENRLRCLGML